MAQLGFMINKGKRRFSQKSPEKDYRRIWGLIDALRRISERQTTLGTWLVRAGRSLSGRMERRACWAAAILLP
jgi:hypothetical protein